MLEIPCVIFAGGKSSRMGEDKSLLPFRGFDTLTEYQYSKLSTIFKTVYISCKNKNKFNFKANFIEDIESSHIFAPTIGFISSFQKIGEKSFFAISVDSPFIESDEINKIIDMDTQNVDATVARTETSLHPLCGIYHKTMLPKFITMLNTDSHKLGLLLKDSNSRYVYFKNEKAFFNINNPNQYQEALKIISS